MLSAQKFKFRFFFVSLATQTQVNDHVKVPFGRCVVACHHRSNIPIFNTPIKPKKLCASII